MASPDRKDNERDAARSRQAALDAKNKKIFADERKRKSDLYEVAAKKAEKKFNELKKSKKYIIEDEGAMKSSLTKKELLAPLGKKEALGEGPISDLSRYADERSKQRADAQRRIKNRIGKDWSKLPDDSYGYKTTKGKKN
jgi:hypothetical protein